MNTVIVKVNTATQTIATHSVVLNDDQPTVIEGNGNVNYELINTDTGLAPHHLITKRQGNDLLVILNKDSDKVDLVIQGFYDKANSALIGQAEDGSYYYYVPDTNAFSGYVTELADGDLEGQALGGPDYETAWWIGIADTGLGIMPWLVGLAGLIGLGSAIANDDDDEPKDTTPPTATFSPTAVVIEADKNNDGYINKVESSSANGLTNILITIPVNADIGDVVTVTDHNDKTLGVFTVDRNSVTAGSKQIIDDVPLPPHSKTLTVTAAVSDQAGNKGDSAQDSAIIDLLPSTATCGCHDVVIMADTNSNGYISKQEFDNTNGKTDIKVTIPTGIIVDDKVIVTDQNGNILGTFIVDNNTVKGGDTHIIYGISLPSENNTLTVTATVADAAGNLGDTAKDTVIVDTTLPKGVPTSVTILADDGAGDASYANDGYLNKTETTAAAANNNTSQVKVDFDANAVVNDVLTLMLIARNSDNTLASAPKTLNHNLTQADIDAGSYIFSEVTIPTQSQTGITLTTTAKIIKDIAGNQLTNNVVTVDDTVTILQVANSPSIETPTNPLGSALITSSESVNIKELQVDYTNEANQSQTVKMVKGSTGWMFESGTHEFGLNLTDYNDIDNDSINDVVVLTIDRDLLLGGSEMTVTQIDTAGNIEVYKDLLNSTMSNDIIGSFEYTENIKNLSFEVYMESIYSSVKPSAVNSVKFANFNPQTVENEVLGSTSEDQNFTIDYVQSAFGNMVSQLTLTTVGSESALLNADLAAFMGNKDLTYSIAALDINDNIIFTLETLINVKNELDEAEINLVANANLNQSINLQDYFITNTTINDLFINGNITNTINDSELQAAGFTRVVDFQDVSLNTQSPIYDVWTNNGNLSTQMLYINNDIVII